MSENKVHYNKRAQKNVTDTILLSIFHPFDLVNVLIKVSIN